MNKHCERYLKHTATQTYKFQFLPDPTRRYIRYPWRAVSEYNCRFVIQLLVELGMRKVIFLTLNTLISLTGEINHPVSY